MNSSSLRTRCQRKAFSPLRRSPNVPFVAEAAASSIFHLTLTFSTPGAKWKSSLPAPVPLKSGPRYVFDFGVPASSWSDLTANGLTTVSLCSAL